MINIFSLWPLQTDSPRSLIILALSGVSTVAGTWALDKHCFSWEPKNVIVPTVVINRAGKWLPILLFCSPLSHRLQTHPAHIFHPSFSLCPSFFCFLFQLFKAKHSHITKQKHNGSMNHVHFSNSHSNKRKRRRQGQSI